jgi:hypothetical protein
MAQCRFQAMNLHRGRGHSAVAARPCARIRTRFHFLVTSILAMWPIPKSLPLPCRDSAIGYSALNSPVRKGGNPSKAPSAITFALKPLIDTVRVMPTSSPTPATAVEVFSRKSLRVDFSESDFAPGSPIRDGQNRSGRAEIASSLCRLTNDSQQA